MKQTGILLMVIAVSFLSSCSLSKDNKTYRDTIKGAWVVENVTYEGASGEYKINAFGKGDPSCFINSKWVFNNTTSAGSYTLVPNDNSSCTTGTDQINWSVYQSDSGEYYLQFKQLNDMKAKNVTSGYRMYIDQLTESTMTMRSMNKIEGEKTSYDIIYHYKKINE